MSLLWIPLAVFLLFVLVEFAKQDLKVENEYIRKIVHIISALVSFVFPHFLSVKEITAIAGVFTLFLAVAKHKKWLVGINGVKRKTLGVIYYPISVALLAWLFLPEQLRAYQFGVLVLGVSDALAAVVGLAWGEHRVPLTRKKSWEGAGAFFLSTLFIFIFLAPSFSPAVLAMALLTALGLALAELYLSFGLDNLVLPLAAGWLMKIFFG